jgi:mono/diheme cytochrome c family protein
VVGGQHGGGPVLGESVIPSERYKPGWRELGFGPEFRGPAVTSGGRNRTHAIAMIRRRRAAVTASIVLSTSLACSPGEEDNVLHDSAQPTESDAEGTTGSGDAGSSGEAGAESGLEAYLALCAPCHGAQGEGTALGYELRHPVADYARWVARTGRPGEEFGGTVMAAYPYDVLSDAQLDEILEWLDGFPQPQTGEALYLDYCGNCHGRDPRDKGVVGKKIYEKSFDDTVKKVRSGKGGLDFGRREAYMPAFDTTRINDAELQSILDWFATLESP